MTDKLDYQTPAKGSAARLIPILTVLHFVWSLLIAGLLLWVLLPRGRSLTSNLVMLMICGLWVAASSSLMWGRRWAWPVCVIYAAFLWMSVTSVICLELISAVEHPFLSPVAALLRTIFSLIFVVNFSLIFAPASAFLFMLIRYRRFWIGRDGDRTGTQLEFRN